MSLVPYPASDSDSESDSNSHPTPATKRRKISTGSSTAAEPTGALPPLPAAFLDQYSSNVRTSVQDDPALHGGRKRTTPHVAGNWNAHVCLEWHPTKEESALLAEVLLTVSNPSLSTSRQDDTAHRATDLELKDHFNQIKSLLQDDLGVSLPLHISLSRPLVLTTDQKDTFLTRLKRQIAGNSDYRAFHVSPIGLAWHPNEARDRWFLVLKLGSTTSSERSDAGMQVLRRLLVKCNDVAGEFKLPVLYADDESSPTARPRTDGQGRFHISIAWSLRPPKSTADETEEEERPLPRTTISTPRTGGDADVPIELLSRISELSTAFAELKVRIGQEVHRIPLKERRASTVVK